MRHRLNASLCCWGPGAVQTTEVTVGLFDWVDQKRYALLRSVSHWWQLLWPCRVSSSLLACLIGLIRNGMLYCDRCHIDGSCYDHAGCHQACWLVWSGWSETSMLYCDRCHIDGICYDHAGCHQACWLVWSGWSEMACSITIGVT